MIKRSVKYIIIIFIFVMFIPTVQAGEVKIKTTINNNYYFFLESYNECGYKDLKLNQEVVGTRVTVFPLGDQWSVFDRNNSNKIELKRYCGDADNCWEYSTFYEKLQEIDRSTLTEKDKVCYENKCSDVITKFTSKHTEKNDDDKKVITNNNYYAHGSWYGIESKYCASGDTEKWHESVANPYKFGSNQYPSCATLNNIKIVAEAISENIIKLTRAITSDIDLGSPQSPNANISNCGNDNKIKPMIIDGEETVFSPALYKIITKREDYYCDYSKMSKKSGCNSTDTIQDSCNKLTIESSNEIADIKIDQKGYVSNVLTPSKIYQGGGIKTGFVYYNTLSWDYANDGREPATDVGHQEIANAVKDKLKSDFAGQIGAKLSFDYGNNGTKEIDSFDEGRLQIECKESGSFEKGHTLTTICTIYLPNSFIDDTGKVSYSNSEDESGNYVNYGINNKYYTDITYEDRIIKFRAEINNLNRLKTGVDDIEEWSFNYNKNGDDNSCNIENYSLIYGNRKKYIYRPINLNNPFPNRNAGVNWFEWISNDSNKQRLEESYTKRQYQIELDNQKVSNIKNYNKDKNYLSWDLNGNNKSQFVDDYFEIKRQNIEGGNP